MLDHAERSFSDQPAEHTTSDGAARIDWPAVLEDLGGDESLLCELIEMFVATYPVTVDEARQGLDRGDLASVARAAHKLVGSVGNFGFGPAYNAARTLEERAIASRLAATRAAFGDVVEEFEHLAERLLSQFKGLRE
jgi:HPt (histidine-containing phosphotransfer) domain-containing protein